MNHEEKEEYENICYENKMMAEFLTSLGYSQDNIYDIATSGGKNLLTSIGHLTLYEDEQETKIAWRSICDTVGIDSSNAEITIDFIRSK